jgi:hypothetical protein
VAMAPGAAAARDLPHHHVLRLQRPPLNDPMSPQNTLKTRKYLGMAICHLVRKRTLPSFPFSYPFAFFAGHPLQKFL